MPRTVAWWKHYGFSIFVSLVAFDYSPLAARTVDKKHYETRKYSQESVVTAG